MAIATAHRGDIAGGLTKLDSIAGRPLAERYYLWHAARGALLKMSHRMDEAAAAFRAAWELAPTTAEKELICRKIDQLR